MSADWPCCCWLPSFGIARVVILPQEVPVGVMTALLGAPFFIMLARKGRGF